MPPMTGAESNYNVVAIASESLPLDSTPPVVTITFPTEGQELTSATISVTGTATDNFGISKVEIKVGSGDFEMVTGTNAWSKRVNLSVGTNTITAQATDTSGNTAQVSSRRRARN